LSTEAVSPGRVTVLVVHGVAAKVPNREFLNLEAVSDLLTYQDETQLHANYRLKQAATVKFDVENLPEPTARSTPNPDGDNLRKPNAKDDAGIRFTESLVCNLKDESYPYTTRRNELIRTVGKEPSEAEVHVHEFFWADLSRPASLEGLHSVSAFLRLICSVCILGTKSLPRAKLTKRAGKSGFYKVLFGVQYAIYWITLLYIPIVATSFLAGVASLYILTQKDYTINAIVPVLAGLSLMVGLAAWYCTDGPEKKRVLNWQEHFRKWFRLSLRCTGLAIVLAFCWFKISNIFHLEQLLAEF
jgi:hypothetical protein